MSEYKGNKVPTSVYLMRVGTGHRPIFKIGATSYPERRRTQIQSDLEVPVTILACYEIGFHAQHLESAWHRFFYPVVIKPHRSSKAREWFHLTDRDIRLFKHVTYLVAKRMQVEPNPYDWGFFYYLDIEALRARFGYED